jgi:undecaprenyl pyrophosphate phosphatase UppP
MYLLFTFFISKPHSVSSSLSKSVIESTVIEVKPWSNASLSSLRTLVHMVIVIRRFLEGTRRHPLIHLYRIAGQ